MTLLALDHCYFWWGSRWASIIHRQAIDLAECEVLNSRHLYLVAGSKTLEKQGTKSFSEKSGPQKAARDHATQQSTTRGPANALLSENECRLSYVEGPHLRPLC